MQIAHQMPNAVQRIHGIMRAVENAVAGIQIDIKIIQSGFVDQAHQRQRGFRPRFKEQIQPQILAALAQHTDIGNQLRKGGIEGIVGNIARMNDQIGNPQPFNEFAALHQIFQTLRPEGGRSQPRHHRAKAQALIPLTGGIAIAISDKMGRNFNAVPISGGTNFFLHPP